MCGVHCMCWSWAMADQCPPSTLRSSCCLSFLSMYSTSARFSICTAAAAFVDLQQQMNAASQIAAEPLCMDIWPSNQHHAPLSSGTAAQDLSATQRLAKLHAKQAVEASGDYLVKFAGQSIIFLPQISVWRSFNHLVMHMCCCHVACVL